MEDLITYLKNSTDKTNMSKPSYMDKKDCGNFSNIYENAKTNYNKPSNNDNQVRSQNTQSSGQDSKEPVQKTEVKDTTPTEKTEPVKTTEAPKTVDTAETEEQTTTDDSSTKTQDGATSDEQPQEQPVEEDKTTTEDKPIIDSDISTDEILNLDIAFDTVNIGSLPTTQKPVEAPTQPVQTIDNPKIDNSIKIAQPEIDVKVEDVPLKTTDKTPQVKVQPQSEQFRIGLQNAVPQSTTSIVADDVPVQPQVVVQAPVQTETQQVQTQAPLVQASSDVVVKQGEKIKNLDEIMNRADFKQNMMDRMGATVTSVETTSNSGGGALLNQNAQEQVVKIAFEGAQNLAAPVDGAKTAEFAKTIDSVQQPKELNKADIMAQIHSKTEAMKDAGTTKITIVLNPENLGKINLELVNGKDGLTARMTTDSAQVKELLDKNLESLKNTLGNQGVNVNNVSVKVAEAQKTPDEMFSFDQQSQQGGENHSSNDSSGTEQNERGEYEFVNFAQKAEVDEEGEVIEAPHNGQVDYKI